MRTLRDDLAESLMTIYRCDRATAERVIEKALREDRNPSPISAARARRRGRIARLVGRLLP